MNISKSGNIIANNYCDSNTFSNVNLKDYNLLDYIQSNGTQYIDTEIIDANNIAIDCHIIQTTSSSDYLYGSRQNQGAMMYNGLYNNSSLEYNWLTFTYTASNELYMTQDIVGNTMHIKLNNNVYNTPVGTTASANKIFIFACNNSSVRYYAGGFKLYYFIMKQGNKIIRNFIPCSSKITGKVGLYDTISNKMFTSKSSSNFIAGNIIGTLDSILANDIIEF